MNSTQLTNYLWYEPYLKAICETDRTKLESRILEARAALEKRLLSPVTPGSEEHQAIQNAQQGLRVLSAEWRVRGIHGGPEERLQGLPG